MTRETHTGDQDRLDTIWPHMPADGRIPDQTVWDHLDVTSAFTGAFAADTDGEAALLALAIGPVQSFIAAARSTSDLWAGSHLLARLSWEAMRVVCECLGPDAILFPRLRGIPQVDLWLRDDCRLRRDWFHRCGWTKGATDGNPLFAAALPNRFVAVVPAGVAAEIPATITNHLQEWLQSTGRTVVDRLLEAGGVSTDASRKVPHAYKQMSKQLEGFPEVHWASVPFSLGTAARPGARDDLDTKHLSAAMAPFFGVTAGEPCGFLQSPAWQVLQKEIRWNNGAVFYAPNPAVLYPAVYDLAERVLAAAKAVRPFEQTEQHGWRCSLTGETEWLTVDPEQLESPYRRQEGTLWAEVAKRRPTLARPGEHLGALSAIKRLWPSLLATEVGKALGEAGAAERFVVSTHTMALASQIDRWLARNGQVSGDLRRVIADHGASPVALPRRIVRRHGSKASFDAARRLPELLGAVREAEDVTERRRVEAIIGNTLGLSDRIETYYALLLMDGDRMGGILSGDETHAITYAESLHPQVRESIATTARVRQDVAAYLRLKRPVSPHRHLAISAALNEFALHVAPHVIEEHLGRLLYAGGDDLLAMLPAASLLPAMQRLRYAYCGSDPASRARTWSDARRSEDLFCRDGFASFDGRLMRMMGGATASCGAVVAHYQAPLAAVLRELRAAEKRAKDHGRNRFSLTVVKRSGGNLLLTAEWGEPLSLLLEVRDFLAAPGVSRRAVYHTLVWLRDLPNDAPEDMLEAMIEYQLDRQTSDDAARRRHDLPCLAHRLAALTVRHAEQRRALPVTPGAGGGARLQWLGTFLGVAEFLARETRSAAATCRGVGVLLPGATQGAA